MRSEAFGNDLAMPVGNRHIFRVLTEMIPQPLNVFELLVRREIVEARRRNGQLRHVPSIPALRSMAVLAKRDTLTPGASMLTFYKMPGHTPGSVSAEFTVCNNGRHYKAFVFGGPGPRNDFHYPNGGIFERTQTLAQRKPGESHPFVEAQS